MGEFLSYIGMGVAVIALVAPMAYCEMRTHEADIELQKACIEAKGDWTTGWGKPSCKLPLPDPRSPTHLANNTGGRDG